VYVGPIFIVWMVPVLAMVRIIDRDLLISLRSPDANENNKITLTNKHRFSSLQQR